MKNKNIRQLISTLCCSVLVTAATAQQLDIKFVAPTAIMESTFGAANVEGFTSVVNGAVVPAMTGFRYTLIVPGNLTAFRSVAPPNMLRTYDSLTTGNSKLRSKLNPILAITGNKVAQTTLFMVDDRTALPDNTPLCRKEVGGTQAAWPCAANWKEGTIYKARVSFGEKAAAQDITGAGGFRRWEGTVLHEFSHTQLLRDTAGVNKWDNPNTPGPNGIEISYGGDAGHWWTELLADPQVPMDEGLANFWALEYNPPSATELNAFLNDNTPRFLLGNRSLLTRIPRIWNAPHTVVCSGPLPCVTTDGRTIPVRLNPNVTSATGDYELRKYSWLNVPGEFVFYNEYMSEAYFYLFHQYGFSVRDTAYTKLMNAVSTLCNIPNERYRYPAHVANMLANSMEAYARSAAGQQEQAANTLVSSMFAYALYDLITHFGMTQAELQQEFEINAATYIPHTPRPLTYTQYWAVRDQVKQIACPFLGGNNCTPGSTGAIDFHRAVREVKTFFTNPTRILR